MQTFEYWYDQDLTKPINTRWCDSLAFSADNLSPVVGVRLYDGGEPVAVIGNIACTVIRQDGGTVTFTGTKSGNAVSAALPGACFAVPGQIAVMLQIVGGDTKLTVLRAVFSVVLSSTTAPVDPGSAVPDLAQLLAQIEACEEATAAAEAVVSSSVRYDAAQTLTTAQQAQARENIGAASDADMTEAQDEIAALRAALTTICPAVTVGPADVVTVADAVPLPAEGLTVAVVPAMSGSGDPAPDNVRAITGRTSATISHADSAQAQSPQTITVAFGSAGTVYGGTLDVINGTLTVTHAYATITGDDLRASGGYGTASDGTPYFWSKNNVLSGSVQNSTDGWCDQYGLVANVASLPESKRGVRVFSGNSVYIYDPRFTSQATAVSLLNAAPVHLVYKLANAASPVSLTPAQITMLTGNNAVWADCGKATLTYRANPYAALLARVEALEEISLGIPSESESFSKPIVKNDGTNLIVYWVDADDDVPVRPTLSTVPPVALTLDQPDDTDDQPDETDDQPDGGETR